MQATEETAAGQTPLEQTLQSPIFILEGEPLTKSSFAEKTSTLSSTQLQKKLMTFDLRFDTLSEFLSNFALVINQHASILNAMYEDSTKKATKKELSGCFKKTADTFAIIDEDFNKQVMLQLKAPRPANVGDSLEDKVKGMSNHMANKMDESKVAFSLLFNQNLELFDRIEKAEQRIRDLQESKADIFYTEQKVDRLRAEMYTRTDEVQKLCFAEITSNFAKLKADVSTSWERIFECEKKTLERIVRCEDLVSRKADKAYVDSEVSNIKEYLQRLLEGFNSDNQTLISDWRASTEESIRLIKEEMNRRIEEIHSFTNIIHEKVLRRVETDKFDDFKRSTNSKIDGEAMKLKELARRVDPMEKRLELLLAELENKFKELNFKFNKLQEKIDKDFKDTEDRLKKGGGANNFADDSELMRFLKKQFMCDAHQPATEGGMVMERLSKLEEENLRIVNDHIKLNALIISLQADIANKIDLATFSMQIGRKIDKDEMLEMIKTLTLDEEKSKKMETDIGKLKKKLKETIDFVEDKLKAFKKDFDMPYLQKLLKAKAEEKDVKNQFKSMGDSLADHKLLFDNLKKDLDGLIVAYKKLSQFLTLLQDEDANTLASSKALLCLSCGRGSKFPPEMKQAMGKDGNMYFVDPVPATEAAAPKYDRAAEVFNSSQGVITHTHVHHHEQPTLQQLAARKTVRPAHGHNRSTMSVRPQSSRQQMQLNPEKEPSPVQQRPASQYKSTKIN